MESENGNKEPTLRIPGDFGGSIAGSARLVFLQLASREMFACVMSTGWLESRIFLKGWGEEERGDLVDRELFCLDIGDRGE